MKYQLLCLFLVLSITNLSWAYTLIVRDDTYSMESSPGHETNNNNNHRRRAAVVNLEQSVNGWGAGERIGFFRFSVESLPEFIGPENIVHATLRLFVSEVVTPGRIDIYRISNDWNERSLNWSNQPAIGSAFDFMLLTENDERRWVEFDATDLVKAWLVTPEANFGIALRATKPAWAMFGTKESSFGEDYSELPDNSNLISVSSKVVAVNSSVEKTTDTSSSGPAGSGASIELIIDPSGFD